MVQLGLKSRVFIYYLQNVSGSQTTNKFDIDFVNEEEKAHYYEAARIKLIGKYGERFISQYRCFIKSEAENILESEAFEARQWLIDNGYLFQNIQSKYKGRMTVRWTGITKKGWEVAPKYLALIGR